MPFGRGWLQDSWPCEESLLDSTQTLMPSFLCSLAVFVIFSLARLEVVTA